MGNPFRRIESPASTALQIIDAHRLFHLVTVIVHGKAMHCRSNCRAMLFYAYCAIISQLYVILCPVADPENFGGGGFEAQNLKNSDVFTKTESDFSAEIGNSNVFFAQN